jgi:hypothetical protein
MAICRLDFSSDSTVSVRQFTRGYAQLLLKVPHCSGRRLQFGDSIRYTGLHKVLTQALAENLGNLLRIEAHFNLRRQLRQTAFDEMDVTQHLVLRFIGELKVMIQHLLNAFALIGYVLRSIAGYSDRCARGYGGEHEIVGRLSHVSRVPKVPVSEWL